MTGEPLTGQGREALYVAITQFPLSIDNCGRLMDALAPVVARIRDEARAEGYKESRRLNRKFYESGKEDGAEAAQRALVERITSDEAVAAAVGPYLFATNPGVVAQTRAQLAAVRAALAADPSPGEERTWITPYVHAAHHVCPGLVSRDIYPDRYRHSPSEGGAQEREVDEP